MNEQDTEIDHPPSLLLAIAGKLNDGEVIAFPTETFYGLLARLDRSQALDRIFSLKGRDFSQPLPVMAADTESAFALWKSVPDVAVALIASYWPGPLTIVLPASEGVPEKVTGNSGKVGVRVPGSAAARGITAMAGGALVATSANPASKPPARSPAEVRAYFGDSVFIVDGPTLPASKGSTVLDLTTWPPVLLRDGDCEREKLAHTLGIELAVRN